VDLVILHNRIHVLKEMGVAQINIQNLIMKWMDFIWQHRETESLKLTGPIQNCISHVFGKKQEDISHDRDTFRHSEKKKNGRRKSFIDVFKPSSAKESDCSTQQIRLELGTDAFRMILSDIKKRCNSSTLERGKRFNGDNDNCSSLQHIELLQVSK
jgi:hypothetical protein